MREQEIVSRDFEEGDEIDLWCDSDDFVRVVSGLLVDGWTPVGGRSLGRKGDVYFSASITLTTRDPDVPVLDIQTGDLRWRVVPLLASQHLLSGRVRQGNEWFFGEAVFAWVLIARVLLRGRLDGDRLDRGRRIWNKLSASQRSDFREQFAHLVGRRLCNRAADLLEGNRGEPASRRRYLLAASIRRPAHLAAGARILLTRQLKSRKTTVLCCMFLGTDGSGKSTQIELSRQYIDALGLHPRVHYWGRTRGNRPSVARIREMGMRLLGVTEDGAGDESRPAARGTAKEPGFLRRLVLSGGAVIYVIDYWLRYLQARSGAEEGTVLLLDRGVYDIAVMKGVWFWVRPVYRLGPEPAMLVLCDAPAEIIYERKQERSLDEIDRQQSTYRAIAERRAAKGASLILDTTASPPSLAARVAAAVSLHICHERGLLDRNLLVAVMQGIR